MERPAALPPADILSKEVELEELEEQGKNERFLDELEHLLSEFRVCVTSEGKVALLSGLVSRCKEDVFYPLKLRAYGIVEHFLESLSEKSSNSVVFVFGKLLLLVFREGSSHLSSLSSPLLASVCGRLLQSEAPNYTSLGEQLLFGLSLFSRSSNRRAFLTRKIRLYIHKLLVQPVPETLEKVLCHLEFVSPSSEFISFYRQELLLLGASVVSITTNSPIFFVSPLRLLVNITGGVGGVALVAQSSSWVNYVHFLIQQLISLNVQQPDQEALCMAVLLNIYDSATSLVGLPDLLIQLLDHLENSTPRTVFSELLYKKLLEDKLRHRKVCFQDSDRFSLCLARLRAIEASEIFPAFSRELRQRVRRELEASKNRKS